VRGLRGWSQRPSARLCWIVAGSLQEHSDRHNPFNRTTTTLLVSTKHSWVLSITCLLASLLILQSPVRCVHLPYSLPPLHSQQVHAVPYGEYFWGLGGCVNAPTPSKWVKPERMFCVAPQPLPLESIASSRSCPLIIQYLRCKSALAPMLGITPTLHPPLDLLPTERRPALQDCHVGPPHQRRPGPSRPQPRVARRPPARHLLDL
jgi:hypothetical protein